MGLSYQQIIELKKRYKRKQKNLRRELREANRLRSASQIADRHWEKDLWEREAKRAEAAVRQMERKAATSW